MAASARLRARDCIRYAKGVAMIELALLLPILLVLALGVIDFARAIQFNNVVTHLSREGANLAARSSEQPQHILKALMVTAEPLEMKTSGMMYVTRLIGRADGSADVDAQYRPPQDIGKQELASRVWAGCPPGGASCEMPTPRPVISLSVALTDGEIVYAVETFYDYMSLTRYVISSDPLLYSLTVL
jgi:hypothetical protein